MILYHSPEHNDTDAPVPPDTGMNLTSDSSQHFSITLETPACDRLARVAPDRRE